MVLAIFREGQGRHNFIQTHYYALLRGQGHMGQQGLGGRHRDGYLAQFGFEGNKQTLFMFRIQKERRDMLSGRATYDPQTQSFWNAHLMMGSALFWIITSTFPPMVFYSAANWVLSKNDFIAFVSHYRWWFLFRRFCSIRRRFPLALKVKRCE